VGSQKSKVSTKLGECQLDDQTLKQYLLKDKASPACSLTSDCLQFNFTLRLSLDCHRSFSAQQ
jgi:hypothetical protein